MFKVKSGIKKITLGILPVNSVTNTEQNDDLIRVTNRIIDNLTLVNVPIDSVVRFILLASSAEGIELEYSPEEKKFRRVKT